MSLILLPVGIIAGIVSTVGGLASLVSYPALLALGLPPVTANVTNTAGLVFTGVGSAVASRRELKGHGRDLLMIMPLTIAGCIVGALLLFAIPAATFQKIVPFFILVAGILVLLPRHIQVKTSGEPVGFSMKTLLAWIGVLLVGVYSGYFGAAGGVLMLSMLSVISTAPFAEYNAQKNLALGAANCISAVMYAFQTTIPWHLVWPLGIGFLIGGLVGPQIVRWLPDRLTKIIIGIGALILAGSLFMQAY
ncbi:sulfite exporter TauE/SafE family protein [Lactiplantibacillus daowaiensis]|uniref:Probable membrane transporter protein n=1 Tax=Lactiplantibacillus daowaiensis TaxID=2559918 RepID=A0ABW1RXQ1_9LACO|nr:sulfite exporter TauE/SafE family protein [Lactiplantibacillus daowaiensis]